MEGIWESYAGQKRLVHASVDFLTGAIGAGFDPHDPKTPTKNVADLTEEEQAAGVIFLGGISKLYTKQDEKEIETELIAVVDRACLAKEVLCEATIIK
jgi:hypothetical protein